MLSISVQGGLGMFGEGAADFTCGVQKGAFYVCSPKTAAAALATKALQRAADAMVNKLPLFITWLDPAGKPFQYVISPIANSTKGIDGHLGPFSAGIIGTALRGAVELRNQATEGNPEISEVVLSAAKELAEGLAQQKQAYNAAELAAFLGETVANWDAWWAAAQARFAAKQTKPPVVFLDLAVDRNVGLVTTVPQSVAQGTKSARKFSSPAPLLVGMAFFGLLAGLGTAAYVHRRRGQAIPPAIWPQGGM